MYSPGPGIALSCSWRGPGWVWEWHPVARHRATGSLPLSAATIWSGCCLRGIGVPWAAGFSLRLRHLWAWSLCHQPQHHLCHSGLPAACLLAVHPCPAGFSMAFPLEMLFGDVVFAFRGLPKAPLFAPKGDPCSSQRIRTSLTATF